MSTVNSKVISSGGSIHLNYAPGADNGISTTVTLSLQLDIDPADDIPKVLVTLELPNGHFKFQNNLFTYPKALGKIQNGQSVNIEFKITCDIDDPASDLAMTISAQDMFDTPVDVQNITYTVKKETTTEGNVSMLHLSN